MTIQKNEKKTMFEIHDVNFDNIDDWDLFNQSFSENSLNSEPLNPDLAEKSIRKILQERKAALARRIHLVRLNPDSEHRNSQSVMNNPIRISLKTGVTAYYMEKFQFLLDLDGITFEQIQDSLSVIKNRNNVFNAQESQGKSGSFFFYSHDKRFIIKTLLKDESDTLIRILDSYIRHIVSSENKSLLVRIYGLFKIQSSYFANLNFILMENVSVSLDPKNLRLFTFDLKGSQSRKNELKKGKVLKCMNFVEINSSKKRLIRLDTDQIERISEILEQDCQYL